MYGKLCYYYSKLVLKLQLPSIRDSKIHKRAKVGVRSNIIRSEMGKYSYTGNNVTISDAKIGRYCSIADYCTIGGGSHPVDWISTSPVFYASKNILKTNFSTNRYDEYEQVHIGNDVWIGEKSFIKSGIRIGNGVIVGAHSVVTHDVPDYAIIAGNPAVILRYRFEPEVIDRLLEIKWWDFDDDLLEKYGDLFNEPDQLLKKYTTSINKGPLATQEDVKDE